MPIWKKPLSRQRLACAQGFGSLCDWLPLLDRELPVSDVRRQCLGYVRSMYILVYRALKRTEFPRLLCAKKTLCLWHQRPQISRHWGPMKAALICTAAFLFVQGATISMLQQAKREYIRNYICLRPTKGGRRRN